MPIKIITLQEAAKRFIDSYRAHLEINSAASFISPTECVECSERFDDLVFALDNKRDYDSAPSFTAIPGGLKYSTGCIVNLFGD